MISRCSVILTHLLNRLVFGDSHDFLLFEHKVSQTQRDEQPLEKLNVEAVRLSHPGIVEPGAVEAAVLAELFDAVRLSSCGGIEFGLSHVSSPVFLVASPVANHVELVSGLPSARDEFEQVMQRKSFVCTSTFRFPSWTSAFRCRRTRAEEGHRELAQW